MEHNKIIYAISLENCLLNQKSSHCVNILSEKINEFTKSDKVITVLYSRFDKEKVLSELNKFSNDLEFGYYIVNNGSQIYHRDCLDTEYDNYVTKETNYFDIANIIMDFEEFESLGYEDFNSITRGCMVEVDLSNVTSMELFLQESAYLSKYFRWTFEVLNDSKVVIVHPKYVSKQTALRWITNKYKNVYIVACGSDESDLGLLTLANKAYIMKNSSLIKNGVVLDCNKLSIGLEYQLSIISEIQKMI